MLATPCIKKQKGISFSISCFVVVIVLDNACYFCVAKYNVTL